MVNPLIGTYLNGRWYNFDNASVTKSIALKNSAQLTQNSVTFSCQGGTNANFTLSLLLENTYNINVGSSFVGQTTWLGVSRLIDLENYAGAQGVSMPITFVAPWGMTYSVVPTGALDIQMYKPESAPDTGGVEFRVTLSLATN